MNQGKELFEKYFKYELLSIVGDRVPNVRMCLSRALRAHFVGHVNGAFVFDEDVNDAVRLLRNDKSADVREPVVNVPVFPMNQSSSNEVNLNDFINRMEDGISRRVSVEASVIGETEANSQRESVSQWMNTEVEQAVSIPNNDDILKDLIQQREDDEKLYELDNDDVE